MDYQYFEGLWENNQCHQKRVAQFYARLDPARQPPKPAQKKYWAYGGGYKYREHRTPEALREFRKTHPPFREQFWGKETLFKETFLRNKKMKYIAAKHIWLWWRRSTEV